MFDAVLHKRMGQKLEIQVDTGKVFQWMKKHLKERKQRVIVRKDIRLGFCKVWYWDQYCF